MAIFLSWHLGDFLAAPLGEALMSLSGLAFAAMVWYIQTHREKTIFWAGLTHAAIDLILLAFDPRWH